MSVVASVLAVAVGLLVLAAAVSYAIRRAARHAGRPDPRAAVSDTDTRKPADPAATSPQTTSATSPAQLPIVAAAPANEPFSAAQDVAELDDIMDGNRPENERLGVALATLESPDKKVRSAALEAVRGLDDRDAVPRLQDLASRTEDPEDKAALLEVVEFLNLPSPGEYAAAHPGTGKSAALSATNRIQRAVNFRKKRNPMPAQTDGGAQTQPAVQP